MFFLNTISDYYLNFLVYKILYGMLGPKVEIEIKVSLDNGYIFIEFIASTTLNVQRQIRPSCDICRDLDPDPDPDPDPLDPYNFH